jgi:hypothetical protein
MAGYSGAALKREIAGSDLPEASALQSFYFGWGTMRR